MNKHSSNAAKSTLNILFDNAKLGAEQGLPYLNCHYPGTEQARAYDQGYVSGLPGLDLRDPGFYSKPLSPHWLEVGYMRRRGSDEGGDVATPLCRTGSEQVAQHVIGTLRAACDALPDGTGHAKPRAIVVMEGGLIQQVLCESGVTVDVAVIDYDAHKHGLDDGDLYHHVPQPDGSNTVAFVRREPAEPIDESYFESLWTRVCAPQEYGVSSAEESEA